MMMMTKTVAIERCRKAIESRCNQHGHIDHADLRDVLADLVNELDDEVEAAKPEEPQPESE